MIEGEEKTDAFIFTSLLVFPQHVRVLSYGAEQGMERQTKKRRDGKRVKQARTDSESRKSILKMKEVGRASERM